MLCYSLPSFWGCSSGWRSTAGSITVIFAKWGELLIGEEDSPDWPYLSLSLDEEVKNFEGDKYIMLRVHKLDLTREKHGA